VLPYDGEVIGAVQRSHPDSPAHDIVVCAAGTLPGELHKLWRAARPGGYHVEYGYSCMGYEIAGGIGVKMARPEREVVVMVGDGSYLMLNSEIATSVMLGTKLVIVVQDNRGYGCIHRLQQACGGKGSTLFDDACGPARRPRSIRRARTLARRAGRARGFDRRTRGGARPGASGRSHVRRRHRHRSLAHDRGGRLVVGGQVPGALGRRRAARMLTEPANNRE
jgi:3D-(3,5/4)-trihydroxycyclohexane-1,2-dione acylhydrolase (decyclizing)